MTDGVHAAVPDVQPPGLHPVVDRTAPSAELHELPARDEPVLALRQRRDAPKPKFAMTVMVNFGLGTRHAPV
jgi:hypothetical protein